MGRHTKEQLEILNQQVKELTGIYHRVAAGSGVSDNEYWVWYTLLTFGEEYSQQDICSLWSLPKQTVNSVVAGLGRRGFAFLEVVPGTRNRKIIRLTDAGRAFGAQMISSICEAEERTMERLSEEERKSCITLLGKYVHFLKEELNE